MTSREERLVRRGAEESPDTDAAQVNAECRLTHSESTVAARL